MKLGGDTFFGADTFFGGDTFFGRYKFFGRDTFFGADNALSLTILNWKFKLFIAQGIKFWLPYNSSRNDIFLNTIYKFLCQTFGNFYVNSNYCKMPLLGFWGKKITHKLKGTYKKWKFWINSKFHLDLHSVKNFHGTKRKLSLYRTRLLRSFW